MSDNPYAGPDNSIHAAQPPSGIAVTSLKVFLGLGIIMLLLFLLVPARRNARGAARRVQCMNNLRNITVALLNYQNANGSLPPAYTVDANGKKLHSWRTLILPFIDEQSAYDAIDLSKPWNDPANVAAHKKCPDVFRCPSSDMAPGHTTYMGITGADALFCDAEPRQFSDVSNLSEVLMVIEVSTKDAVHWMAPQDTDESFVLNFGAETELAHAGGTSAAFGDGSVRFLSKQLSDQERQAMISVSYAPQVSTVSEDVDVRE